MKGSPVSITTPYRPEPAALSSSADSFCSGLRCCGSGPAMVHTTRCRPSEESSVE